MDEQVEAVDRDEDGTEQTDEQVEAVDREEDGTAQTDEQVEAVDRDDDETSPSIEAPGFLKNRRRKCRAPPLVVDRADDGVEEWPWRPS